MPDILREEGLVSPVLEITVRTLFALAASIWVGGLVTLVVVARVTRRTLSVADRVATFRGIGRAYGPLAGVALIVALALGLVMGRGEERDVIFWLGCGVAAALIVVTIIGIVQARAMPRARWAGRDESAGNAAKRRTARSGRRAAVLRAGIGILTGVLVVLGSVLTVTGV